MKVMSSPVILVSMILDYIATLTEVIVADHQMVQLRDTGTSLMGLKLGVSHRRMLLILGLLETSSLEIGILE